MSSESKLIVSLLPPFQTLEANCTDRNAPSNTSNSSTPASAVDLRYRVLVDGTRTTLLVLLADPQRDEVAVLLLLALLRVRVDERQGGGFDKGGFDGHEEKGESRGSRGRLIAWKEVDRESERERRRRRSKKEVVRRASRVVDESIPGWERWNP